MRNKEVNRIVSQKLMSDLIALSKQKFSSNVIEKCLEFNDFEMNREIVESLMDQGNDQYFDLLSHQYGNYVVQKCLQVA